MKTDRQQMRRTVGLIAISVALIGALEYIPHRLAAPSSASAASTVALSGYAWSSNLGWIKMKGTGYGVIEDLSSGMLTGYAWSNVGWIHFGASDADHQAASVNLTDGHAIGFARACAAFADKDTCSGDLEAGSGGWDGWIRLGNGPAYGAVQGNDCSWSGYSWGSDNFGWIHWNGVNYGVTTESTACNQVTATLSATPSAIDATVDSPVLSTALTWSSAGATSCSSDNFSTGSATAGSVTAPVSEPTTVFTVTCTNGSSSASANTLVTINYPGATVSLTPIPPAIARGNTVSLQWSVSNVKANLCSITENATSWSVSLSNSQSGSGSVTSPAIVAPTSFTLTCTGLDNSTPSNSVTVGLLPDIQEI